MAGSLPPPERRMTRVEVARCLGISKSSVRRLEGAALTPFRTGRGVVFDREEVEAYARSIGKPAVAAANDHLREALARAVGRAPADLEAVLIVFRAEDRIVGTASGTIGSSELIADAGSSEMLTPAADAEGTANDTIDSREAPEASAPSASEMLGGDVPDGSAGDTCDGSEREPLLFHMLRRSPMDLRSVITVMNEFARGELTLDETNALIMQVVAAAPKRLVAAYDAAHKPSPDAG